MMNKSSAVPMKRAVWRNFCYIFIFFLIVTLFIAVFMYSHTKNTLETELLKSNEDLAEGYAEQMDAFFISLNRLNATLAINQLINSYIASPRLSPGCAKAFARSWKQPFIRRIISSPFTSFLLPTINIFPRTAIARSARWMWKTAAGAGCFRTRSSRERRPFSREGSTTFIRTCSLMSRRWPAAKISGILS